MPPRLHPHPSKAKLPQSLSALQRCLNLMKDGHSLMIFSQDQFLKSTAFCFGNGGKSCGSASSGFPASFWVLFSRWCAVSDELSFWIKMLQSHPPKEKQHKNNTQQHNQTFDIFIFWPAWRAAWKTFSFFLLSISRTEPLGRNPKKWVNQKRGPLVHNPWKKEKIPITFVKT